MVFERTKPPIIVVAIVDHPHSDVPVKHIVFLLPGALQLLILEGLVGSVEIEVSCIDGFLLGFQQTQTHLKNPIEECSALVDGFARDIAAVIILFLLDLPRPLSRKLAVRGDIQFGLCAFALAVGPEPEVLEDLFLELLRAGDFVLLAHALHHGVVVVLDGVLGAGAVELPRQQGPLAPELHNQRE